MAAPDPGPTPAARLTLEVETALLRELRSTYQSLCFSFFKTSLRPAGIALSNATGRLGRFVPDLRVIEMSRELVMTRPWGVVLEVLKHEIAHQYVHEVLGETSEAPHGPAFQ